MQTQDMYRRLTLEEKLRLESLLKKATVKAESHPLDLARLSVPELRRFVELHKKIGVDREGGTVELPAP